MGFQDFKDLTRATAERYGYDPGLLAAQAHAESAWNPLARSHVGAQGLMQFMPATWADWGRGKSPTDPAASLDAGVRYMQWIRGALGAVASPMEVSLAAYNWGIGNMQKLMNRTNRSDWPALQGYVPTETREYVTRIKARVDFYRGQFGAIVSNLVPAAAAVAGLLLLALIMRPSA